MKALRNKHMLSGAPIDLENILSKSFLQ